MLNTYIDGDNFHVGFNIQRLILGLLTKNEKPRALRFSTRFARGKDEDTSNPFSDEVRSVSSEKLKVICGISLQPI